MRTSAVAILFAAGFVAAQQGLEDVPKCAAPCIEAATTGNEIGGCGQFDIKCICSNSNFLDNIACCLEDKCDATGKAAAVKFAQQICSTVSVDVPDKVECKSNGGGSSSTVESETETATGSPTASPSAEQSETSGAAGSEETGDDGDAATGLNSVGGLVGAVVAMAFAL